MIVVVYLERFRKYVWLPAMLPVHNSHTIQLMITVGIESCSSKLVLAEAAVYHSYEYHLYLAHIYTYTVSVLLTSFVYISAWPPASL